MIIMCMLIKLTLTEDVSDGEFMSNSPELENFNQSFPLFTTCAAKLSFRSSPVLHVCITLSMLKHFTLPCVHYQYRKAPGHDQTKN